MIDTHVERDTEITDITGPYLSTEMDELAVMFLHGALAYLITFIDPDLYHKYIVDDSNRKPILYVKLPKALYGYIRTSLIFYEKLTQEQKSMGFILNPYDPCLANKMVNGQKLTLLWHLDDLKLSHYDDKEVTKVNKRL